MNTNDATRVLVVENHPIARKGIVNLLNQESDLCVCAEADDASGALNAMRYNRPDAAVVDIGLGAGGGLDLIRRMIATHPQLPILVLSLHEEVFYAERALRAGARGYVTKTESCERILKALRDVIDGRVYVSMEMANQMLSGMVHGKADAPGFPISRLTDREFEIFELLGQGLHTREIASQLHISVGTVDAHREHIKKKLNIDSAGKLLVRAIQWSQSGGR